MWFRGEEHEMSFAYANNRDDIWHGRVPDKYDRVRWKVTGHRVVELGGAEGVLTLSLARYGRVATSIDRHEPNHREALLLKNRWRAMFGSCIDDADFVLGDVRDNIDVMKDRDSLVAVRSFCYLGREDAEGILAAARVLGVWEVVLCANGRRARDTEDPYHELSSIGGMVSALESASFKIVEIASEGDPIVVARSPERCPV